MTLTLDNLTIGIPVYNDAGYIESTIRNALIQNARIIVADNGSTDGTSSIVQRLAAEFNTITVITHPENIGGIDNFYATLEAAQTPHFMWLGSHDLIPENYGRTLTSLLETNTESVGAFAPVSYIDEQGTHTRDYHYWYADMLAGPNPFERVKAVLLHLSDCTLIHGIYKTDALKQSRFDTLCYGFDVVVMAKLAAKGQLLYSNDTMFYRREFPTARKNVNDVARRGKNIFIAAKFFVQDFSDMKQGLLSTLASVTPPQDTAAFERVKKAFLRRHAPLHNILRTLANRIGKEKIYTLINTYRGFRHKCRHSIKA